MNKHIASLAALGAAQILAAAPALAQEVAGTGPATVVLQQQTRVQTRQLTQLRQQQYLADDASADSLQRRTQTGTQARIRTQARSELSLQEGGSGNPTGGAGSGGMSRSGKGGMR